MVERNGTAKRIAIVLPTHWDIRMGGSQYQVKLLVDYLLEEGYGDIHFLGSRVPEGDAAAEYPYRIYRVGERKGLREKGFFFDAVILVGLLKRIDPDVIYQRVGNGWTGICAWYAKKYKKNMIWHIAHDRTLMPMENLFSPSMPLRYVDQKFMHYGIRNAGRIVAQTSVQQGMLRKEFDRDATVIPNFHHLPDERTLCKDSVLRVLWIANLKAWKRPKVFIDLARELQHLPNVEFVMIGGDQGEYAAIRGAVEACNNLSYLGQKSQDEVNDYLSRSHLFVNTSKYEGFPNTYIQAWMRKVPVLGLDVDPDGVISRFGLGIFAGGDYAALKHGLLTLLTDDDLRRSMGETSRQYAETHFSARNIAKVAALL